MRMKRYGSMLWVLGLVCVLTGGCSTRGEISRLPENGERETMGTEERDLQQKNNPEQEHEQAGLVEVDYHNVNGMLYGADLSMDIRKDRVVSARYFPGERMIRETRKRNILRITGPWKISRSHRSNGSSLRMR